MKLVNMATAWLPACLAFACGTKKDEKKVPLMMETRDTDVTITSPPASSASCQSESSEDCASLAPGEMIIVQQNSWLNPEHMDDGRLLSHDGNCLEEFTASKADEKLQASLDLKLEGMTLRNNKVHCRAQIRVSYAKGYAFAIRRLEVPLTGEIPVDSQAVFSGSYGIKGKNPLVMQKVLGSQYSEKTLRVEHSVANEDIVWSHCSGDATLILDTELSMNFSRSDDEGSIRIEGPTPYRLEVIWAKCL